MKKSLFLIILCLTIALVARSTTIIVTNNGQTFTPNSVNAFLGDTIDFQLSSEHNVVEVSKTVWNANGSVSNGGFLLPFGGGKVALKDTGIIYYVCEPHSIFGMKGSITVSLPKIGDTYIAKMSGMQEEFPFAGFGTGDIKAVLIGDTLKLSGSFKNLSGDHTPAAGTGAHIHRGFAGTSGAISITLNPIIDASKKSGSFVAASNTVVLTADQKNQLKARELYVNIHTTLAPGGEIRGQLLPESDAYFQANLTGDQENPSIMSPGHGSVVAELIGTKLMISGSAKGLISGVNTGIRQGGHLHLGFAGQNGGIQLELKPTLGDSLGTSVQYLAVDNSFDLTPAQLAALKASQLYANIHTNSYGGGEIRGQVTPMSTARFRVHFSGAYEPIPVPSMAGGALTLNLIDSTLSITGSFNGLESNWNGGNHLHKGLAGLNGGIQLILKSTPASDLRSGTYSGDSNVFKLTSTNLDDLFARRLYGNVHSVNYPGGEIRGQVLPECQFVLFGFFSGMQENKPIISTGKGNIVAEVNGTKLTLSGYAEKLLDKANRSGISHLHKGQAGTNGGVSIALKPSFSAADSLSLSYEAVDNSYNVTAGFIDTLKTRGVYANIHTSKAPGGEVRAQLNGEAAGYFFTRLSGSSETTPINTNANGAVFVEIASGATRTALLHGSFASLGGKWNGGSHIHNGLTGTNAGVRYSLFPTMHADSLSGQFFPANNTIGLSAGGLDSLRHRFYYANVHTTKAPGGEIRGNLLNLTNATFTASLSALNEIPSKVSNATGAVKVELVGNQLTLSGSFSGLIGDFNGGAHIHNGVNGVNGAVLIGLKVNAAADNKSGQFLADSNKYTLTADQLSLINAQGLYVNVHTTTSPGGEIRGQLLPEANFFPTAAAITAPAPTDTVKVDLRVPDSTSAISWTASTDPDGNPVVYKIQNTVFPDFSIILSTAALGPITSFSTTYASIDSVLSAAGVPPGGSITSYNRIIASDGSLNTIGAPSPIIFVRAFTTDVLDAFAKSFSMAVYPVPAVETAIIEMKALKSAELDMQVIDLSGRTLTRKKLQVTTGVNQFKLDVSNYPTGTHFIQFYQKGVQVAYFKLVKS